MNDYYYKFGIKIVKFLLDWNENCNKLILIFNMVFLIWNICK